MAFTTANLISSIERMTFAPTGQTTFTEAEILAIADEETKTKILPNIMAVREEYYVFHKDYSITAGKAGYDIPARAVGLVVREVQIINSSNTVTDLPRIEPEDISSYSQGSPDAFYLKGNQVVLDRNPSASSNTLRLYFYLRPGDLVLVDSAGVISDITNNVVTVSSIPSTWVTGNVFDFIKQDGGHEYIDIDQTSTDITSNAITFAAVPSTLRVGDYVSLAGQSPLVQMPPDYRPVLARCAAASMLEFSNQPGAERTRKLAERDLEVAQKMITPRVVGEDRVITPINWW